MLSNDFLEEVKNLGVLRDLFIEFNVGSLCLFWDWGIYILGLRWSRVNGVFFFLEYCFEIYDLLIKCYVIVVWKVGVVNEVDELF